MAVISDIEIRLRADIARLQQDMNAARRSVDGAMNNITQAANRARAALGGIVAGIGVSQIAGMVDQYVKFTSQLRLATESQREYNAAYADVKRIAAQSTQGLGETGTLYARIANGVRELGVSQRQLSEITEVVNLSLLVSGATASEAASAQLQLSQAFASGTLRGEEFNAVNEAAPRLMKALADGIGVPVGALKKMAEEGLITSDIMARVLPNSLESLRNEAKNIQTISGSFVVLKNSVIEFVGTTAEASGSVAAISTILQALASNLNLVAGAFLTVIAVKFANFLDAAIVRTAAAIRQNNALIASNLATAQAEFATANAADRVAGARLNEVRAATLASAGNVQLALTTNGLIPAQANAARTSAAMTSAFFGLAAAQSAATVSTRALNAALAFTGGPIGLIVTVLGAAATAWGIYEYAQQKANSEAAADTEASTSEITASLEKQNNMLRERIRLQAEAGASPALSQDGPAADRLQELLVQINALKKRGTELTVMEQLELINLGALYDELNKQATDNLQLKQQQQANGQAAKDLVAVRERLNGVNQQYMKDLNALQTALAKGAIGQAEYNELVSKLATETYKASDAGREAERQAKQSIDDAKRQKEAYRDLISTLQQRVDETAREAAGLPALTAAEKEHLQLTRDLAEGKIKLSKAEQGRARSLINEAAANEVLAKSNKEYDEFLEMIQKNIREAAIERSRMIKAAEDEAKQNELLVTTFGMTEDAIIRLSASRLLDQEAQRLGRELTEEEISDLQRVIELKERSAKAVASRRELEETKQFWTDIEKTARDTFVSIADGGKNAFQRLKDTAKNVFFDWLYQQTLKKWIINIGTASAGTAGVSGIANAAGAGGPISLASSASNLYGALTGGATLAGGLGTGFLGSLAGGLNGAGVGSGLTSALGLNIGNSIAGVLGPTVSSSIAAGLGSLAAAAPWVAGAVAVFTVAKKAFGRGPKEFSGNSTLSGSIGADGLNASILSDWVKKGGWFRSDKRGTDSSAVDAELASGISATYEAIKASSADYARALGLNADSIANRSQAISIAFGKDEAANQKAIADFFSGVADSVAREVLPDIARFQQQGETVSSTLQRVATNFQAVQVIFDGMGVDSASAFRAVGTASIEARERLLAFAGGIESLASQTTFFTQNFLSQAEQIAIIQKPLAAQLEALGYAGITTADQFKEAVQGLVNSGALATEQGARTYAGLLALGPEFKTVADYLQELKDAAAEEVAAKLAEQQRILQEAEQARLATEQKIADERARLQDELDDLVLSAAEKLQKQREAHYLSNRALFDYIQAIKAQQTASQQAADAIQAAAAKAAEASKSFGDAIFNAVQQAIEQAKKLRDFSDSLNAGALSNGNADDRYRAARAQFEASNGSDTGIISAFLQASRDRGAADFFYNLDFQAAQSKIAQAIRDSEARARNLPSLLNSFSSPPVVTPVYNTPAPDTSAQISSQAAYNASLAMSGVEEKLDIIATRMVQLSDQFDSASEGGQGLKQIA